MTHVGPKHPPTETSVLITELEIGVRPTYHLHNGCEWSKVGYNVGARTRWVEESVARSMNMRTCRRCLQVFEPNKLEALLLECIRGSQHEGYDDTDVGKLFRMMEEKGIVVKRKPGYRLGDDGS